MIARRSFVSHPLLRANRRKSRVCKELRSFGPIPFCTVLYSFALFCRFLSFFEWGFEAFDRVLKVFERDLK
jgi:hypothetical protein